MAGVARDWRKRLVWELRAARRLFVLGVGNPDLADDGAGCLCVRLLGRRPARSPHIDGHGARGELEEIQVLDGGEVPESATGLIRKFRPTHVLIIDAAAGGHAPGTIFFMNKKKILDDDLTTHRIPLSHLVRYLEKSVGCRVILLGIEPGMIATGRTMSPEVNAAVLALSSALTDALVK
jgi:hydrogenase 3 maturation protease